MFTRWNEYWSTFVARYGTCSASIVILRLFRQRGNTAAILASKFRSRSAQIPVDLPRSLRIHWSTALPVHTTKFSKFGSQLGLSTVLWNSVLPRTTRTEIQILPRSIIVLEYFEVPRYFEVVLFKSIEYYEVLNVSVSIVSYSYSCYKHVLGMLWDDR